MNQPLNLRASQKQILAYRGGRLGVSAVPGSGKTHVLSALAAKIISSGVLQADQEVLIVTLVNSAVENFELRIRENFDNPVLALYRYRVRTLHGLAHDILREKPAQAGLEERFTILDEREADSIRREVVTAWLSAHPEGLEDYLDPGLESRKRDWVYRQHVPELLTALALAFIRSCKDRRLTPQTLRERLDQIPSPLPLAELGWQMYTEYQRGLVYRSAVDFDDLIRLALDVLEDKDYLERLRYRFPFILEDEAQDSSKLQETILRSISGPEGNWVRVGDPNQAIFETFTTASPQFLRDFIRDHYHVDMPESGRSQPAIIALANHLIEWVMSAHPMPEARDALQRPLIAPAPAGDPQPNPPEDRSAVQLIHEKFTAVQELEWIVDSLMNWLPGHPDSTVVVLAPRNLRGFDLIKLLKERRVEFVELLNSTMETRAAAGALGNLLGYLAEPGSSTKLAKAYQVWRRDVFGSNASDSAGEKPARHVKRADAVHLYEMIRKIKEPEAYLAPRPDQDWLASVNQEVAHDLLEELLEFRDHARRWLNSVRLPIDQLILTLAQDIFTEAADLALAHKLALVLRKAAADHPEWRLPELSVELSVIARNERRFIGFGNDDSGFDPQRHKGKVVVTTMHKSKGLEWDRVYLMSVNNYDFPSNQPNDQYISEKWFVRNSLNLEAEVLEQLRVLFSPSRLEWYEEGSGTRAARLDYSKERLRLLYVGITRAKKDLIITWNTGRQGNLTQSLPFAELTGLWQT